MRSSSIRNPSRLPGVLAGLTLLALAPANAWAIPSPDVMVGLFASSAQLLGLASAALGGWLWTRRGRGGHGSSGDARAWKRAFLVTAGLGVAACVGWGMYAADVADQRMERLRTNLTRSSREDGRTVVDLSLRELSFSKQLQRPDGVATQTLVQGIANGTAPRMLDVRESEEYEVAQIAGAAHARFPDVMAEPARYLKPDEPVLLLCFNGNRSSEMAEALRGMGYDCSFLVGGYEKWLAEDRPVARSLEHERVELRELPPYPNQDVLLDTPEVLELASERDVLFLDVRYPGDFEGQGHLPGAINVPMRKLTTAELDAALAALPRKPVIVPCYDRRSSFFGSIAGLRLSRLGFEFLGRYMTPESYWVPGADKPHVAAWKAAKEQDTLLSRAGAPFASLVSALQGRLGSLALAVLACALLARFVLLPFALRTARDKRVERSLAPQIAALRARFAGDRAAFARARVALLHEHGQRPLLTFVGAFAQLLLLTVLFTGVGQAALDSTESFAWVSALGAPDPFYALPLLGALGTALLVLRTGTRIGLWRTVAALGAAGIVGLLAWWLPAATQLYLAISIALILAQDFALDRLAARTAAAPERARRRAANRYGRAAVVPLAHAHQVEGLGPKVERLAHLAAAGLPVPDGFAVRLGALHRGHLTDSARRSVLEAFGRLGVEQVAVRSSAAGEDGERASAAGVFESKLGIERGSLIAAVEAVAESFHGERAQAAGLCASDGGSILVQRLVPAAHSGVLFTEHPAHAGSALVELVEGLGDALVSGRAEPRAHVLGRVSGALMDGTTPPFDLTELHAHGRAAERLFGAPQDVEWARDGQKLWIVQSRHVTRRAGEGQGERARREAERARWIAHLAAKPDDARLAQDELTELAPEPTPLTLSLLESLWAENGAVHQACASLGVPYRVRWDSPPLYAAVYGQLYVDRGEQRARLARGASALALWRLGRQNDELEREWTTEIAPAARTAARRDAALDLARLELAELVSLLRERRAHFAGEGYARCQRVNLVADLSWKAAVRALERRKLDPATHLSHVPDSVAGAMARVLECVALGSSTLDQFLVRFGHRGRREWELSAPRLAEEPEEALALALRAGAGGGTGGGQRVERRSAPPRANGLLGLSIERALRWQVLREDAKDVALHDLALLRRLALAIGERTGLGERVFLLRFEELERLDGATALANGAAPANVALASAVAIAEERADERAAWEGVRLPAQLAATDLERLELAAPGALVRPRAAPGALSGLRVSGTGGAIGRARVLHDASESAAFEPGEVLVARFTDPAWMPLFARAGALVTEVGGWLSHAAIQAREHGLPAVVGVRGALSSIATGDLVRLSEDGRVEVLTDRRREGRERTRIEVRVSRTRGPDLGGRLADRSASGALLCLTLGELEIGEELVLAQVDGPPLSARVIRNGTPLVYGLELRPAREARSTARAS